MDRSASPHGLDGDGPVKSPVNLRAILVLAAAILTAALLAFTRLGQDLAWAAVTLAVAGLLATLAVALGLHELMNLLLPVHVLRSAIETRDLRRAQRAHAESLAGSNPTLAGSTPTLAGSTPTNELAPNSNRSVAWGVAGLIFPPVGPVAIWYGQDALNFVRISSGVLGGGRRARAGLILGLVGTAELVLLFVLVAMYPTK